MADYGAKDSVLGGEVYFLSRNPIYNQEKPYTLRYAPELDFPQTNIERSLHKIKFQDMRDAPGLIYDKCGFTFANYVSAMRHEDFESPIKIETLHQAEIVECVKKTLNASSIDVLDYVVNLYRQRLVN
jgi:hypothetical protein